MKESSQKFADYYKKLNAEQKAAVDTVEGPVMVIAGPGTGKTQVLTLRVANILLKTQVNPGNILAMTFTESGAAEMRQRLSAIIGRTAYQVNIFTFHSFCNDLIQTYPEEFPAILGRKPSNEIEQIELVKKVIDETDLKLLRPFGETYFYLREARRMISHLKREGVGPEDFRNRLAKEEKAFAAIDDLYYDSGRYKGKMKGKYTDWKKQIDKNVELAEMYRGYQEALVEAKQYDYDDMILEVAKTLAKNESFLLRLQEQFQYFLVDEHQDTNNAQNKVLELLSGFFDQPNLFVVGDEKQAIFRFQGASLENFLYFKKLYPGAKLITLKSNYRSTQPILDAAHDLIGNNQRKLSDVLEGVAEGLVSATVHPKKLVEVYSFKQTEAEHYFVSQKISELLKEGISPEEIAVIYRDNRDAFEVGGMLDKHGVPFRVESGENILASLEIRNLINVLRFLNDFSSEEKLFEILSTDFLGIPALDVYRLHAPGVRSVSLLELLQSERRLQSAGVEQIQKVKTLGENLLRWQKLSRNTGLLTLFETVIRESGFLATLLAQKNSAIGLTRLEALFREVKRLVFNHPQTTLADFVRYLDNLEEHQVGIKAGALGYTPKAVRLMTAHGAKGLEFDHVFIVNCFDGHWGNRRIPKLIKLPSLGLSTDNTSPHPDPGNQSRRFPHQSGSPSATGYGEELSVLGGGSPELDDERRLFYVAITRARKMAYLSYALQGTNQKTQSPSQFLEEIKPELKGKGEVSIYEERLEKNRAIFYEAPRSPGFSIFEKDYLNELFYRRGLSATALNNYLACPWRYFYLNLLKIPRAKSKSQMYGTAVHAALKDFFNALKDGQPDLNFLLERFKEALEKEPLLTQEAAQVLVRGNEVLAAYYNFYQSRFSAYATQNEFKVTGVTLEVGGRQINLTGSLDKIEYLAGGKEMNVVDYKTGKPRTRNELEGKTKNATGDYKRQLTFYKLLLDEMPGFSAKMISGEIDFVEPDKSGKFHKERFTIEATEAQELKAIVVKTAEEIISLGFWDGGCRKRDCEFCQWRINYARV
ncbi:MAG: ATP-dependent DNA helicase [bacterium]|nr:ATP-dependent DNA helicase [bacterium]